MNDKERAFVESLYREMAGKLMIYARRGLRNEALAEEAVQDAFRIACSSVDKLMASENPRGWMTKTLMNVVRKVSAAKARDGDLLVRLGREAALEESRRRSAPHPGESDPDIQYGDMRDDEDYRLLRRIADSGCTVLELAEELGISVDACYKRLQRARKRLRKYFEEF